VDPAPYTLYSEAVTRTRSADPGNRLSPANVIDRAVALADAEGLEVVTVRRLTKELGVTPMALYWHFRNKGHLLDALVERVVAKIDLTVDEVAPWPEQLETLLGSAVVVLRAHPWCAAIFTGRGALSESYLGAVEAVLAILNRGGFTPVDAVSVARHALRTITALVTDEPGYAPGGGAGEPGVLTEAQRKTQTLLASLPPDRYPRLVEAAVPLSTCDDPDAYYAFGIRLLRAGTEAIARDRRTHVE